METNTSQEAEFITEVIGEKLLEKAISHIIHTFEPNELYSKKQIQSFIQNNYSPDDIFKDRDLQTWAESNGYIKED